MTYLTQDIEIHNEQWLEAAKENYETAMSEEDWSTALAVIDDVKRVYGATAGIILSKDFIRRKTSVSAKKIPVQEEVTDEVW